METIDRLQYCAECTKRRFDVGTGVVCSLTGEKPKFEGVCPQFNGDITKVRTREEIQQEISEKTEISGFLWWYLYIFVSLGALATIIMAIVSLSSFEPSIWMLDLADAISSFTFAGIGIYTIYAFNKRLPNAVALAKIHLVLLVVMNVFALLVGATESTGLNTASRLVGSVIWAIIFFIYMFTSDQVNTIIPKGSRYLFKGDKIVFSVLAGLYVVLLVGGFLQALGYNPFLKGDKRINQEISAAKSQLPITISEELLLTDLNLEDKTIVYTYTYTFDNVSALDFDFSFKQEMSLMAKERLVSQIAAGNDDQDYLSQGYNCRYIYQDQNGDFFYDLTVTASEYTKYHSAAQYRTDESTLSNIVNYYNSRLPEEYIGGAILISVEYDSFARRMVYELMLEDLSSDDLYALTDEYLRGYMDENFQYLDDDILELAYMNDLPVVFRFNADLTSLWSSSILFTPDQYKTKVQF